MFDHGRNHMIIVVMLRRSRTLLRYLTTITSSTTTPQRQQRLFSSQKVVSQHQHRTIDHLVASTQKWLDSVVIGEKLCPFAPPLLASKTLLRIVASTAVNTEQAVAVIKDEVHSLLHQKCLEPRIVADGNGSDATNGCQAQETTRQSQHQQLPQQQHHHETSLVVFDDAPFVRDFRDFVRLSWALQDLVVVQGGFVNDVQLVLFHPQATHQTYSCDDDSEHEATVAANYTIRSPYPVIHLLRQVDVMRAVQGGYPNLDELPARNKQKLSAQGLSVCRTRLEDCYVDTKSV
jgi:hypothetical protein